MFKFWISLGVDVVVDIVVDLVVELKLRGLHKLAQQRFYIGFARGTKCNDGTFL